MNYFIKWHVTYSHIYMEVKLEVDFSFKTLTFKKYIYYISLQLVV